MAGSTVDVEWNVTNSASLVFMYVFDSKASYDKWKRDPYSNSWLFKVTIVYCQFSNFKSIKFSYLFLLLLLLLLSNKIRIRELHIIVIHLPMITLMLILFLVSFICSNF